MSFPRYPAYKDSGVEWLGEIPADWSVLPAKYGIASKSGGQTTKNTVSAEPGDGLFPAFSASGQDIWMEEFEFEGPALVLSAVGARCGKTFKADGRWGVVANTHCLFPRREFNRDFLWYLTNREDWWERGGTAQPFVKVSETLARKWVFPTPCEQAVIAQFLDHETAKIDALVAEQERLIELLKEKRQAVISLTVTKGLDPSVPMKDSGVEWLGEVPAHWTVQPLGTLTHLIQTGPFGSQLHSDEYVDDATPVVNPSNIIDGQICADLSVTVTEEVAQRLAHQKLVSGDIVVGRRGEMGRCAVVQKSQEGWLCGTGSLKLHLTATAIPDFIWRYLSTDLIKQYLSLQSVGSTMENLNTQILARVPVPVPTKAEQAEICTSISEQMKALNNLELEAVQGVQLLRERRTALISAAVTGQIDVRGWTPAPDAP